MFVVVPVYDGKVCESAYVSNKFLTINCGHGKRIKIIDAIYGRKETATVGANDLIQ